MFKRLNIEDAKMRVERSTPATLATPATQSNFMGQQSSESSESSKGAPSKLHFLKDEDNQELFEYLLNSITTGGPYAKLWPNVRTYCRRTLTAEQFQKLQSAYETHNEYQNSSTGQDDHIRD